VEIVGSNRACKGNNGEGAEFIVGSKNHQSRPLLWPGHECPPPERPPPEWPPPPPCCASAAATKHN